MRRLGHLKLWTLVLILASANSLWAQKSGDDDLNTKVLIFTDEIEEFLDHAWELYETGMNLEPAQLEKEIQVLMTTANRIAAAYFVALDTEVQPKMEAYLHEQYKRSSEIHHYFLLIGNAIYSRANHLVDEKVSSNRQLRRWGTVGGTIVGLAAGTATLYFKRNLFGNALHATIFVIGLGAAGAAVGYSGAFLTHRFILPANPSVENAKDFLAKYPSGQDFIDDLSDASTDIALGMLEIEEALGHAGSL